MKKRHLQIATIATVVGGILLFGGYALRRQRDEAAQIAEQQSQEVATADLIPTPNAELMAPDLPTAACEMTAANDTIQSFVNAQTDITFSIAYYEPDSGCEVYVNADTPILAASTSKVVLAMMVYEQVAQGTMTLTQQLTYDYAQDYEAGAGVLQSDPNFRQLDIATLVEVMITESDNIAKNMLLRALGGREAMHAYVATITGITSSEPTMNKLTARQQLEILRHLQQPTTPGSSEIIQLMQQTSNQTRLAASVNADGSKPVIAHKVGDYVEGSIHYLHDIGIVEGQDPFTLVVLTQSQPVNESSVYKQITRLGNALLADK